MVTPEVYPQAAAAAGCTASYSVIDTASSSDAFGSQTKTWYRLSAVAVAGWRFSRFEWTQTKTSGTRVWDENYSTGSNPYPASKTSDLLEQKTVWAPPFDGNNPDRTEINYCRAVFVEDIPTYGDITVTTAPDPAAGGTTSPTSETHLYSGSPTTTFTLVATANAGYRFFRWKLGNSVIAYASTTTVTHTFTSSAQTFHYVAEFLPTGLILHGAGGSILRGSGGSILHSG